MDQSQVERKIVVADPRTGERKVISFSEFLENEEHPIHLYKYRSWSNPLHQKIIKNREVFLASPIDFEDPKDCKNHIRYDLLSEEQLLVALADFVKRTHPNWNGKARQLEVDRLFKKNRLSDGAFVQEMAEKNHISWSERSGVLSLALNPNIDKMWMDYSDKEEGICVSFHTKKFLPHVGGGAIVNYVKELPTIFPKPFHDHDQQVWCQIYNKEEKWSYEDEYRTTTFNWKPLMEHERKRVVNSSSFHAVVLGKQCPNSHRLEIRSAIEEYVGDLENEHIDENGRTWLIINSSPS